LRFRSLSTGWRGCRCSGETALSVSARPWTEWLVKHWQRQAPEPWHDLPPEEGVVRQSGQATGAIFRRPPLSYDSWAKT
jgi:hypothetical protein